jgi:hypothetical protein
MFRRRKQNNFLMVDLFKKYQIRENKKNTQSNIIWCIYYIVTEKIGPKSVFPSKILRFSLIILKSFCLQNLTLDHQIELEKYPVIFRFSILTLLCPVSDNEQQIINVILFQYIERVFKLKKGQKCWMKTTILNAKLSMP